MGAQESKLSFRRGIFRLHEERNIPANDAYWANYWTLPESAEDIFTLFSATDIRKARDEAPENIETLILEVVRRLFHLRHDPRFPSEEPLEREMLNCLRLLTRVLPFMYEDPEYASTGLGFLWESTNRVMGSIADFWRDSDHDLTPKESSPPKAPGPGHEWNEEVLAEFITKTLVELLFFCGFTIPASYGRETVVYGIWETGVGCTVPMGTTRQFESNKIETLRCLLALMSRGMYVPANDVRVNRQLMHLVMMIPKNVVLALLCSLLNTTMKFQPTTWRTIPYSSSFLTDSRQLLVSYSLQFLLVVLTYPLPKNGSYLYQGHKPDGETTPVNQFAHYFRKLHRANDFNFMVEGMSRVLHQPLSASSTYLPGSQQLVKFYPEMLLLFWESLQQNKRFRSFLIETDRALDFLVVLLFYALEFKLDPAQIGLVRMCVFILQPLSAEAKFARRLNKTFEGQASLPVSVRIPSFSGTYADFLIISIYSLITTSKGHLNSLHSALFMTISNIAPYIKNISVVASTKILQLFTSISSPSFLLANDSNFKLLQYLLEFFNSTIEHNFNENPHLMYAILRAHTRFEALQELTLSTGLQAMSDLRNAKAKRVRERQEMSAIAGGRNPSIVSSTPTQPDGIPASGESDGSDAMRKLSLGSDKVSIVAPVNTKTSETPESWSPTRKLSVSSDLEFPPPSPRIMSEKARGKLPEGGSMKRQNSSSSIQSTNSFAQQAILQVKDFTPSSEWFDTWFPDLDMSAVTAVLNQTAAEVTRISQETPDPRPIVKYLEKAQLEGVTAQTPNSRTFVWSEEAKVWFESLLFGYIYLSETQIGNGAVGVWTGTHVKLFRVMTEPSANGSALFFKIGHTVDAVANQLANTFHPKPAT